MQTTTSAPLFRPKSLIRTARIGAQLYQRDRDLAGALPGRTAGAVSVIIAQLHAAEQQCESLRRDRSPAYKPARHVQILAAFLAESKPPTVL